MDLARSAFAYSNYSDYSNVHTLRKVIEMDSKGPTKAEYEELVKGFSPDDVIGAFRVTRLSNALEVKVCTMRLQRDFEFSYMIHNIEASAVIHQGPDDIVEDWMNWRDISSSGSTDGFVQKMTLDQMRKCIEHNKKWTTSSIFAEEN